MLSKYIKHSLYAAAVLGVATACEPEIERDRTSYEEARGEADFSTYVALGNSLTAGYADGALNREGQLNSYPAIIASKIDYINPNFEFDQPLLPEGTANGTLQLLGFTDEGLPMLVPASGGLSNEAIFAPVQGSFNNLGVPGAKVGDLTMPGYGSAQGNPYFARFASSPMATVVQEAIAQDPTFFTLWIGNNDVLGYATQGGEGTITPTGDFETSMNAIVDGLIDANSSIEGAIANIPNVSRIPYFNVVPWNAFEITAEQAETATAGYAQMIDPEIRRQVIYGVIEEGARRQIIAQVAPQVVYQQAYEQARAQGATDEQAQAIAQQYVESEEGQAAIQGLTTNLIENRQPAEVHAIVEANLNSEEVQAQIQQNYQGALQADANGNLAAAIGEEGAATVDALQEQNINQLKEAKFYPVFAAGPNGFVVYSEQSPTGIKQLGADEKMLLTFLTQTEYDPASGQPVPDRYALDQFELAAINNAISDYNSIIADIAQENTFALVDMNGFFSDVADGYTVQGTTFSTAFITGNAFSLDGVHLSQKGYALVAKRFIETINSYYGSQIPDVDVRQYPAVGLPR